MQRRGCIYGESIGKGRNGFLRPVGNPDVPNTVQKQGTPSELEHEAEIMHELRHPNVVQSFGLILAKGPDGPKTQCLVLEHMKCSLEDIMKTRRYRSKRVCAARDAAHWQQAAVFTMNLKVRIEYCITSRQLAQIVCSAQFKCAVSSIRL